MNLIIDFFMNYGYILAAVFAVIWIGFEIADFIRKKKIKQRIHENNSESVDN